MNGSPPAGRSSGSAWDSSSCTTAATRTVPPRSASWPAGRSGCAMRRRCPISAGTRSSGGGSIRSSMAYRTGPTCTSSTPSSAAPADRATIVAETDPGSAVPERGRARQRRSASSSTPSGAARRPARPGQLRGDRSAAAAARPAGRPTSRDRRSGADAPPTGDPVPRRGRWPGRQGHPVRRPGRRGRPGRAGGALRRRGRGRDRLPRHHAPRPSDAARSSRSSSGRPADVFIPLTVGGGVRRVDDMRRSCGPAPTRSALNTAAVADPTLIAALRGPVRAAGGRRRDRCPSPDRPTAGWEVVVRGGREATGLDAVAWAVEAVATRRGRAARDLDRSRRDAVAASTRSCSGRSSSRVEVPGDRLRRRRRAGRLRRGDPSTAGPTPCWPRRSSIAGSTRSPTSRRPWPPPVCRSGSSPARPAADAPALDPSAVRFGRPTGSSPRSSRTSPTVAS